MPPHPLPNFEIQKYYQNELELNGIYSKCNLPKIKAAAYVINFDVFNPLQPGVAYLYPQKISENL